MTLVDLVELEQVKHHCKRYGVWASQFTGLKIKPQACFKDHGIPSRQPETMSDSEGLEFDRILFQMKQVMPSAYAYFCDHYIKGMALRTVAIVHATNKQAVHEQLNASRVFILAALLNREKKVVLLHSDAANDDIFGELKTA